MGRLEDKLAKAAGVAARLEKSIEDDADALIAREAEITSRKKQAFGAHNARMDMQHKSLDRLEDALQILDNGGDPLPATGSTETPATEAAAKPADQFQPTH